MKHQKKVIIIAGPTAVGKTSVAIELAQRFNTEIISADSRQCYKELNIGVARPSPEELSKVKHHFIASHSITEEVTAAVFEEYALQKASELFKQHDTIIMVGGTGLYIKAFCEGLDTIPAIDEEIREKIREQYDKEGLSWLQEEMRKKDPAFYHQGEIKNPQRMMRALEVVESTGQSILSFRTNKKKSRDFQITKIGLELPKEHLHNNINLRVDKMMKEGLLSEAKELVIHKDKQPVLLTVGYRELFDYLDNKTTLDEAVALIKQNTRQYAKRQMTWFKKDEEYKWTSPDKIDSVVSLS